MNISINVVTKGFAIVVATYVAKNKATQENRDNLQPLK